MCIDAGAARPATERRPAARPAARRTTSQVPAPNSIERYRVPGFSMGLLYIFHGHSSKLPAHLRDGGYALGVYAIWTNYNLQYVV
jgi:hypothetical protein